jgi:hypothetical protein
MDELCSQHRLEESHGELAARVLLGTALDRIRLIVKGMRLEDLAGYRVCADDHRQGLTNLFDLPENLESLRKLTDTHPTTVSTDL